MDTTVTERKFGSARAPRKAPVANRLFAPCGLASKGIYYHMNHLRKLWKLGKFPEPIRLSPRKIAWRESTSMPGSPKRSNTWKSRDEDHREPM